MVFYKFRDYPCVQRLNSHEFKWGRKELKKIYKSKREKKSSLRKQGLEQL